MENDKHKCNQHQNATLALTIAVPVQLSANPNLPAFAQHLSRTATFLRVGEHQKETAEEFGQMLEQVEIGHRVEDADPTDDELSNIVIIVEHLLAVVMEGHATGR